MKKLFLLLFFIMLSIINYAQNDSLQPILDSIIKEADLLYSYEKAAWISTDLIRLDQKVKNTYYGYFVYHSADSVFAIYHDKDKKNSVSKYSFALDNLDTPKTIQNNTTPLTDEEKELLSIKAIILNQLNDSKYEVIIPKGYNPNVDLIKGENGYRLYIIMGVSESGIIPFGNDYLFKTDKSGNIIEWQKFHNSMLPAHSKGPNGQTVVSFMHSHLVKTPYISATDICTFRLYAPFNGIKEFGIYSKANGKTFKYNIDTNKITVSE